MNANLIHTFRAWVNSNKYCLWKYRGERIGCWHCLCSAMDWITVAVDYLSEAETNHLEAHRSDAGKAFMYIMHIGMLKEGIEQLHRVVFDSSDTVFKKDNNIFPRNQFGQRDSEWFETLRACFGAHPVNLKNPKEPKNKKRRYYASWSFKPISLDNGRADFAVELYPSSPLDDRIQIMMNLSELSAYANKLNNYIDTINGELIRQHRAEMTRLQSIPIAKDENPVKQLLILESECDNRFFAHKEEILLLTSEISACKDCMSNNQVVVEYKNALIRTIPEYYDALQNMSGEIENPPWSFSMTFPDSISYERGKLGEYVRCEDMPSCLIQRLFDYVADAVTIDEKTMPRQQIALSVRAALYQKSKQKGIKSPNESVVD